MITGPTTHTYVSQRLKLRYADWGNPEAPPLILLHGGRDHSRSWDWAAEQLRADWHVICPDLRGHGDSDWSPDGDYGLMAHVYDFAQLIHQLKLAPVSIIAHSYGGAIALRYAGLYPDTVTKLVAIEGLGPSPKMIEQMRATPVADRIRSWIDAKRAVAGRTARKYASLDEAFARMRDENHHLSEDQARHLTLHGISQNEDGSYSWKFDNYFRVFSPFDIPPEATQELWGAITCPTLMLYGQDSWASNPVDDGRIRHFRNARVLSYEKAGHWLHHDQFERFMADVTAFLAES
jgi:pimeloyl-ACP methyl ester carboxylesterase